MGDLLHIHDPHGRAQRLLPWLVNGTLDSSEEEEVQSHLAECGECRADLERERELRTLVAETPIEADDGWARLNGKVAGRNPPVERSPDGLLDRRVPLTWAIGVQGAVAAGIAAIFLSLPQSGAEPKTGYHLLSSSDAKSAGNLIVLFAPDATEQRMRAVLAEAGARITDGPTASGAYVLAVEPSKVEVAMEMLRKAPETVLTEPISQDGER